MRGKAHSLSCTFGLPQQKCGSPVIRCAAVHAEAKYFALVSGLHRPAQGRVCAGAGRGRGRRQKRGGSGSRGGSGGRQQGCERCHADDQRHLKRRDSSAGAEKCRGRRQGLERALARSSCAAWDRGRREPTLNDAAQAPVLLSCASPPPLAAAAAPCTFPHACSWLQRYTCVCRRLRRESGGLCKVAKGDGGNKSSRDRVSRRCRNGGGLAVGAHAAVKGWSVLARVAKNAAAKRKPCGCVKTTAAMAAVAQTRK